MALPVVTTINRTDQSHASRAYSDLSIVSVPPNNPTVRILRTAGQVGTSAVGSLISIPASFHEQAKNAFANVAACLSLGSATPRDITKITIYVVNFELWMREVLVDTITNFFTNDDSQQPHKPPSTLLGVTALASEDFLIEVEAEAMIAVSPLAPLPQSSLLQHLRLQGHGTARSDVARCAVLKLQLRHEHRTHLRYINDENLHDDHDDEGEQGEWSTGAGRCQLDIVVPPHDRADVWGWSYPDGDRVSIDLTYGNATMARAQAEAVADLLVEMIEALTRADGAEMLADVLPRPSAAAPRFPLPEAACATKEASAVGEGQLPQAGDGQLRRRAAEEVVKRACDFVLGDSDFDPDTPFYDIWGDQVAAAQLPTLYRREGFHVGMEELIDRPRMREKVELLSSM